MRLYVTPSGRWAGTQAEAKAIAREEGTGWEQVDVPTDKEGLLTFLNCHRVDGMCGEARAMMPEVESRETPALSAVEVATQSYRERCKYDRAAAERLAEAYARLATTDARVAWIDQADAGELGDLAGAVARRLAEMAETVRQ